MIRLTLAAAVVLAGLANARAQTAPAPAKTADEKRQLEPHEHGKSQLALAIEGNTVSMDFDAPGDDIVGFETEAKSEAQKSALAAAKRTLSMPGKVFVLTPAAGCKQTSARVEVNKSAEGHTEFESKYTFTCTAPEKIADLDVRLFKSFANAKTLVITVVSAKGQAQFQATAKSPRIDLKGAL